MSARRYTHKELVKATEDALTLFIEYRDVHGYTEEDAKTQALLEVWEGTSPAAFDTEQEVHEWQGQSELMQAAQELQEAIVTWKSHAILESLAGKVEHAIAKLRGRV